MALSITNGATGDYTD